MLGSRNLLASNGRLVSADTVSGEPVTMVVPPDQSSVLGWSWGPTPIKIPREVGGDSMAHESQCCPTLWHSLPPFLLLLQGDSIKWVEVGARNMVGWHGAFEQLK